MKRGRNFLGSRRAQVTIFVIIAVILIGAIAGYFILRGNVFQAALPAEYTPIYDYYLSCIEKDSVDGLKILGTQGGYITAPEFEPGSEYAPFSSQLDFLGFGVPYWYYVAGNNVLKEQVPTKKQMQTQLGEYLNGKVSECDFTQFEREGYIVELGKASASTTINSESVDVVINQDLSIRKAGGGDIEGPISVVSRHAVNVKSKLGKFYDTAREIYDYEKSSMFLENYARDALYLYAPVEGTELSCAPMIWNPYEVADKLKNALEVNMQFVKVKGSYYDNPTEKMKYFVVDSGVSLDNNEKVNFVYSKDWASRFEVWPTKNSLMIAEPVGTQEGLSTMGFCYISYKFVYDMFFPVMIQVQNSENAGDIFQFPVAVVVSKNQPRDALQSVSVEEPIEDLCTKANTEIRVNTYDTNLEPVEANLQFKCINSICDLGKTNITGSVARLTAQVPQCVNGVLIANAEGYKEKKQTISTNEEFDSDIILSKEFKLNVEVYVDGKLTTNTAVLSINENKDGVLEGIGSVAYPFNAEARLTEAYYNFVLKVYSGGKVNVPEYTKRQCVTVPKTGLSGVLGFSEEKCFDYTIPAQVIENVLYAGGSADEYFTLTQLENADTLKVYAESVALPTSADKLQSTYDSIDVKKIVVQLD